MSEIRSLDREAHSPNSDSRDCAAPPFHHDFEDWWGMLDGKPSCIPASRVSLGFYARRESSGPHIGVAIWLGENDRPCVKLGSRAAFSLSTDEIEAQFSVEHLAWMMAVPEEAYRAWAATGEWPEGTVLDRPRPKVERAKTAVSEDVQPAEKQPAVFIRLYQTIDPPKTSMAFMARAIARSKGGGEGFSVGFYADTAFGAQKLAEIWIAEERAKAERAEAARQARAAIRRRPATHSDQPETEGASA
ncbi:hypothetical protein [Methylobacterium sp. PvR107]|uniref:hypothetical protein n=1 Tax=Methylobacterium sp. PvR107 TaxID=2806597 RepID=UPI001AE4BD48|nr:hypothetical protein [Methylobacterium sp. PvR107]MBP1180021.1 hypothetical protein [Methylobacterium sp. PvR107]